MDDEKKRKVKKIKVKVLKAGLDNAMVEFMLDKVFQRATIPTNFIDDEYVEQAVLEAGIPYGIPWELVELKASPIDLANILRKNDIWTVDDAMRNPNKIISALQAAYGVDLAQILKFAREYK